MDISEFYRKLHRRLTWYYPEMISLAFQDFRFFNFLLSHLKIHQALENFTNLIRLPTIFFKLFILK